MDLKPFLDIASSDHKHVCPRQILGVRFGLRGMEILGFEVSLRHKHFLVISETDGCFIDGVIAVTRCTVGHRRLRVQDYGKVAATFVNLKTGQAVRIAPTLDVREKAQRYAPEENRHYFAQMKAYQIMPDEELMSIQEVTLNFSLDELISHSGIRVNCAGCGEEIINEREVMIEGKNYCKSCAGGGYYQSIKTNINHHTV
ncbi:MAG TPA: FmdE family protein [Anaerolineales bacterium]|nr:FmdE family protein [Anaerolineales bacterium]